ncbi:MAG: hypothetical protein AAGC54_11680 [Cyanobacteria bacterium P01_F01_bin.4]
MNKYIVGGILSLFSLLVIYGARSSGRVVRWVDGDRSNSERTAAQADLVSNNGADRQLIAQTDTENMTPLQKAGTFPQRQTFTEGASADVTVVPAASNTTPAQPNQTAQQSTPAQPATTTGQGVVNPQPANSPAQPVRALW